jgi:hypothetical protein
MGISKVLSPQRSHRRGAVFNSAEFANSIRRFYETATRRGSKNEGILLANSEEPEIALCVQML